MTYCFHAILNKSRCANYVISLLLVFIVTMISWIYIPLDPEEMYTYFPLHCWFPHGLKQIGISSEYYCRSMSVDFFSFRIPIFGNGLHQGIFPSFIYAPIFFLFPHPFSFRLLHTFSYFIQAVLLAYAIGINTRFVIIFLLLFYPYAIGHLIDKGPVGYQTMLIIAIFLVLREWSRRLQFRWLFFCGLLVSIGFYIKITQFWLLPGILGMFVFFVFYNVQQKRNFAKIFLQAVFVCLSIGTFVAPQFLIHSSGNYTSRLEFLITNKTKIANDQPHGTHIAFSHIISSPIWKFLFHPFHKPHLLEQRYTQGERMLGYFFGTLLYGWVPVVSFLYIRFFRVPWKAMIPPLWYYCLFVITALVISATNGGRLPEHAILCLPFFIIAVLSLWKNAPVVQGASWINRISLITFIFMASTMYLNVHYSKTLVPVGAKLIAITSHPSISQHYLQGVFHTRKLQRAWMYFFATFGGKDRIVFNAGDSISKRSFNHIFRQSRQLGRRLLFLTPQPHDPLTKRILHHASTHSLFLKRCSTISTQSIVQVYMEFTGNGRNPCFTIYE